MPSHNAVETCADPEMHTGSPSRSYPPSVETDLNRALYEAMTPEEIRDALKAAGIDPRPTIDAVTALVSEKLANRSRRRSAS
jgi:hypothetical protein